MVKGKSVSLLFYHTTYATV